MVVYFTGDTHFGDHRTINIHRPYASDAEMDAHLTGPWNAVACTDAEVRQLGDFARRADDAPLLPPSSEAASFSCAATTISTAPLWLPAGRAFSTLPRSAARV